MRLLLLLSVIPLASILWSRNPMHTMVDALTLLLLTTLFAVYLCRRYPGNRIVLFLTFSAFVALLLCTIAVIAFPNVGVEANEHGVWRGIFGQRNNCAATCTLFLVVALHARTSGLVEQLMRASVVLLSLLFIVMSGSRQGWILSALALALTYGLRFIARIRSLDRLLFLMVLAIPASLAVMSISTNFNQILAVLDKDPTLTQRTVIWAQVVPSIAKHPLLGYGYSAFWAGLNGESMQAVLTTGWMEGQAQDGYLDVLLQVGLLGFIPLGFVLVRGFVQAFTAVERGHLDPTILLAIVLLPLILIENIGESLLLVPLGIPWFYAFIALLTLGQSGSLAEEC